MRPSDFSEDSISAWCEWVLVNGLPPLPRSIEVGEAIPVAFWTGPKFGAVTLIARYEPDPTYDEAVDVVEDVHCYRRTTTGWSRLDPDGGTDWPPGADLSPLNVPPTFARLGESLTIRDTDWGCTAVTGVVGRDAAWVEVVTDDGSFRQPVVAPIGVVVICVPTGVESSIRVHAADGTELGRHTVRVWQ